MTMGNKDDDDDEGWLLYTVGSLAMETQKLSPTLIVEEVFERAETQTSPTYRKTRQQKGMTAMLVLITSSM